MRDPSADSTRSGAVGVRSVGLFRTGLRAGHRRTAAVLMAMAVAATVLVGGLLTGGLDQEPSRPVDRPARHDQAPAARVREIVYGDGLHGRAIHFGDRVVETGVAFAQMDVTDDGFVYSTGGYGGDGRVWFSDGGVPEQIGSEACEAAHGFPSTVVSANSGSLVAWLECATPSRQSLVVFDTSSGRDVVHQELAECRGKRFPRCTLDALIGGHVYFTELYARPGGRIAARRRMFDLGTGASSASSLASYAEEISFQRRGLVLGDSWLAGTPVSGIGEHFVVVGSRLVPEVRSDDGEQGVTTAFDTATRQRVSLHLPAGYHRADGFELFEWLDDGTVALVAGGGWPGFRGYGDILTCRLSDGRCELTVRGTGNGEHAPVRIVPHLGLPG